MGICPSTLWETMRASTSSREISNASSQQRLTKGSIRNQENTEKTRLDTPKAIRPINEGWVSRCPNFVGIVPFPRVPSGRCCNFLGFCTNRSHLAVYPSLAEMGLGSESINSTFYSNSVFGTPDCRMMERKVPTLSSLWSGTGTVTVPSSFCRCMITWLPRRRTSTMPGQDRTHFLAGKHPQFTQLPPQRALRTLPPKRGD